MDIDTLQKFCANDSDPRHYFCHPNTVGEFTYATNGEIMIRVPKLDAEFPAFDKLPDFECVIPADDAEYVSLPELPPAPEVEDCPDCNGDGVVGTCPYCPHEHPCHRCGETGRVLPLVTVAVGRAFFDRKYLALIADFPGIEVAPRDFNQGMRFRFDGGIGVVMPMRNPE